MNRRCVLVVLLVVLGLLPTPTALAQEDPPRPGILLVLDASGSMNAADDTGRTLLDGAKESLFRLIDVLPEGGVDVGLRVYGHRTTNDDPVRGCADSELVVPVGPLDSGAMRQAIDDVRASGYTPIGISLTEAAADLDGRDAATVILVSDGEDTCEPPDPCEVAHQIADAGITVNTVGFYLEDGSPARGQLECIADASGGTYADVDEADALAGVVGLLIQSVPGVGNLHLPLDGALRRSLAPEVVPVPSGVEEGLVAAHTTEIAAGETRWFRVEVPESRAIAFNVDARPFLEVAIPDPGDEVVLHVVDAAGDSVAGIEPFALGRMDLGTALAIDLPFFDGLGVATGQGVPVWFELEPFAQDGWEALGVDEATWNRSMRDHYRHVRPEPLPAGSYYVGITWRSGQDLVTRTDYGVWMWSEDGRVPAPGSLVGALEPGEAPVFAPDELPGFDPWLFPRFEEDPDQELWAEGPIEPGETRWYALDLPWEAAAAVEAQLNVPADQPAPSGTDRFAVTILDPTGTDVTDDHPAAPAGADIVELPAYERRGYHDRPLVAATAREPGPDSPPPGRYLVGVTWDATADVSDAIVEIRLGTREPEGMVETGTVGPSTTTSTTSSTTVPTTPPTTVPTPTTVAAGEADSGDGGGGAVPIIVTLVVVLGGLAVTFALRRR